MIFQSPAHCIKLRTQANKLVCCLGSCFPDENLGLLCPVNYIKLKPPPPPTGEQSDLKVVSTQRLNSTFHSIQTANGQIDRRKRDRRPAVCLLMPSTEYVTDENSSTRLM